jgi:predicted RNA-binding Zn-ribbon protein involved in translation (DUF1610 family)
MNELAPRAQEPLLPALSIRQAVERFNTLVEFVQTILREGIDYGTIPGTTKPTLLKPGAEKLTTFFGLTTRFQLLDRVEDWSGSAHDGEPFFYYLYRCQLFRATLLIAEADASCNSRETKYRNRRAERVCPRCGQATIIKGKAEYGGGWLCYGKKGGCGAKFAGDDPAIAAQPVGRIPNPDVADQVNTIQKMAQKRALIGATLLAVNASEFFTQDVEDWYVDAPSTGEPLPAPAALQATLRDLRAQARARGQPVRELSQRQVAAMAVSELVAEIAQLRQQIAGRTVVGSQPAGPVGGQHAPVVLEAHAVGAPERPALPDGARARRS